MKLIVIKIENQTFYSHHLSSEQGCIWFKEFRRDNYIKLPKEVEQLTKDNYIVIDGKKGYLICEDPECFKSLIKWEQGSSVMRFEDALKLINRQRTEEGINYPKIQAAPLQQQVKAIEIPMLNVA